MSSSFIFSLTRLLFRCEGSERKFSMKTNVSSLPLLTRAIIHLILFWTIILTFLIRHVSPQTWKKVLKACRIKAKHKQRKNAAKFQKLMNQIGYKNYFLKEVLQVISPFLYWGIKICLTNQKRKIISGLFSFLMSNISQLFWSKFIYNKLAENSFYKNQL